MTYFDCFVVGAWMLAIGWYLGAIYMQNHNEKAESPRVVEKLEEPEELERRRECETWRVVSTASAAAD
jgi:hypothetical protein